MSKREDILKAGAKLFAKRSYDAVGIRDIANEANVNSAMISYYFRGKVGLLREIFLQFDTYLLHQCTRSIKMAKTSTELITVFVDGVLDDARQNQNVYLVGLKELNHDSEELQDLRDNILDQTTHEFLKHTDRLGIVLPEDEVSRDLGFTATLGIIFSDYLVGGRKHVENDQHYEIYKKTITDMLLKGLPEYWR